MQTQPKFVKTVYKNQRILKIVEIEKPSGMNQQIKWEFRAQIEESRKKHYHLFS